LENLKSLPAQIISKRTFWKFSPEKNIDSTNREVFDWLEKRPEDSMAMGKLTYVIKDAPPLRYGQNIVLQPLNFMGVQRGGVSVFFIASIEYKDLTSGNRIRYRCIIRIQVTAENTYFSEYQYNENIDE